MKENKKKEKISFYEEKQNYYRTILIIHFDNVSCTPVLYCIRSASML